MAPAFGQIPRTLSYQGVLTDATGTPKPDGVYDFTIRLYTVASGGSALWSETKSLQIKRGLFSTILGSLTPLPASVKFDQQYWLSVQVAPDPELSPRIQLTSVGSSLNALRADLAQTVPDSSLTQDKMASGQVVKSINTLKDDVTLSGGSNVTITRSGDTLKIAASGGSGGTDFWAANGNDISNANTGNVGIGTTTPAHRLSLIGGPAWTSNGWTGSLELGNASAIGWKVNLAGKHFGIGQSTGGLYFFNSASDPGTTGSPANNKMIITDSGDVGIGTNVPQARLDVSGAASDGAIGVSASAPGFAGVGVKALAGDYGIGVEVSAPSGSYGVYSLGSYGVFGIASHPAGFGVYSSGNMGASGTKPFRIDHPKDPTGKYLQHYSAESPDVLNMYTGNTVTDADGYATIALPDYFGEINKDPRYTLTVINEGGTDFVQAMVVQKIQSNRFVIRTSKPATEVSWEVKAVRNDLWVRTYGAPVQLEKQGAERGKYQHPELYGMPAEMGINYHPEMNRPAPEPGSVGTTPGENKAKN